jgi:precorrin isomerase
MLPPWNEQDDIQRSLNLLMHELDQATTSEDQDEIVHRIRVVAATGLSL